MKKTNIFAIIFTILSLTGCARDLSHSTYTSDATMNVVLFGRVLSMREVTIKEHDKLEDNKTGALAGAVGGGLAASKGSRVGIAGAAIGGGIAGALIEQAAGTKKGMEYIVQVDISKIKDDYYEGSAMMRNAIAAAKLNGVITVVQSKESKKEEKILEGQKVLVIISEKRTRIIPDNTH